jgi:hypothetical protein
MCSLLSSSGITRLLWYYEAIRLPVPHMPSSLFSCPAYSLFFERNAGPPGLPCNHNARHAMVSDHEEATITLPLTVFIVLTSTIKKVSSFPTRHLRGSNAFILTAYGLSARSPTLKPGCYHTASKDSLPGCWPAFRDGIPARWTTRPYPTALLLFPPD